MIYLCKTFEPLALGLVLLACVCAPAMARGLVPTKDEFALADRWVAEHFAPAKAIRQVGGHRCHRAPGGTARRV